MSSILVGRSRVVGIVLGAALSAAIGLSGAVLAKPAGGVPEKIDALMIGDRVVDIAFHLGALPAAMSVRGDYWAFGRDLGRTTVRNLGCPGCIVQKDPEAVPRALRETGIKRVLVERSEKFDLLKPARDPMNALPIIEKSGVVRDLGVNVEIVDFRDGLDTAILRVGEALGKTEAARELVKRRTEDLAEIRAKLPTAPTGVKVVVLNGTAQTDTGKAFTRVELPGGYSDTFLLRPLGLTDVGREFLSDGEKGDGGYLMIRSLEPLRRIKPDALVLTGDADAVQRVLAAAIRRDPGLVSEVPALRSGSVFALPAYMDSEVIEYPSVLRRWAAAFAPQKGR